MNKNDLNAQYRECAKNNLSPTQSDRDLVTKLYAALKTALGDNCLLIGSYARFTSIRPLHDIDVLFVGGRFDPLRLNPQAVLNSVLDAVRRNFKNPTQYSMSVSQQSHSITITFLDGEGERLGIDIVPAFTSGIKNEYDEDIYWVPEIVTVSKHNRPSRYEQLTKARKSEVEWWLKSDPRGYIRATTMLNDRNGDFRKAAKFIKKWKHSCCATFESFKLKSFHVEQVLFGIYLRNPDIDIADSIFDFFCALPEAIARPQIRDRADSGRFIDQYLAELTDGDKQAVIKARDFFLVALEYLSDGAPISELLKPGLHTRASSSEEYLFDSKIPVFIKPGAQLSIVATALPRDGGFRAFVLDALGIINVNRKIKFEASVGRDLDYDLLKWKVKNDSGSPEPRGEITDHNTRNNPESTRYKGRHYVECYAINDNICVARHRQNVQLSSA